jgi:hypothetical protein
MWHRSSFERVSPLDALFDNASQRLPVRDLLDANEWQEGQEQWQAIATT